MKRYIVFLLSTLRLVTIAVSESWHTLFKNNIITTLILRKDSNPELREYRREKGRPRPPCHIDFIKKFIIIISFY